MLNLILTVITGYIAITVAMVVFAAIIQIPRNISIYRALGSDPAFIREHVVGFHLNNAFFWLPLVSRELALSVRLKKAERERRQAREAKSAVAR